MTASLQEDLAALNGEELYNLVNELISAERIAQVETDHRLRTTGDWTATEALAIDAADCRMVALAQIARITVPIREAAAIVYRTRYGRGRPIRVPGT